MKDFTFLIVFLAFSFLIKASGVSDQSLLHQSIVENNQISISKNEVIVGAAYGSSVSVEIISQDLFYFIIQDDWLSVHVIPNHEISADNSILVISASRNPFDESRTASIRVYNDAGEEHFITVLQNANTLNLLELSDDFLTIDATEDSTFQIDIKSNTNWTVATNQSWVNVSQNAGNGNQSIGISAATNPSGAERNALVTVTANGATTKTITIKQWGQSQLVLEVSTNDIIVNYYWDDSTEVDITSNTTWTAVSNQEWLIINPASGSGNGEIYISSIDGEYNTTRQGTVTISGIGAMPQTIQVYQNSVDDYYINVPQTDYTVNTVGYGLIEIPVSSNTYWQAWSNYGIVDYKPEIGFSNETLYIVTEPNFTEDDNYAEIWIDQRNYEGDIEDIMLNITIKGQSQPFFVPDAFNASIAAEGNSEAYITIFSNIIWTATSNQPWLTIDNPTHEGHGSFILTATTNENITTRYGTITISSAGYGSKTILVTQPGNGIELPRLETLTPNVEIDAANGSTRTIEISSNLIWSASSDQSWLTLNKTMGSNDGDIIVTATENNLATARQAFVTISAPGVDPVAVVVTQAAATPTYTLTVSNNSINIAAPQGSTASVNITSNTAWTVASNQTWLTVSPTTGSNNGTLTFTAAENTASTTRQATVTVSGTGVNPVTITVTQAAAAPTYTLTVSNNSINIAAPQGSTASVTITSNTAWTVASNQTWLTVSPTTGSNNGTLTFTAAENTASTTRQATVTVSGTGVNPVTIIVTQAAANILIIDEGSTNITIGPESGTTITISIQSNTSWTATSDQAWLNVSPASGTNNGTITVSVEPNPLSDDRQGTITITANGISITIFVNQTGNVEDLVNVTFNVDLTYVDFDYDEFFIAGSFNDWGERIPMTADGNIMRVTLQLPKNGTIYYKYLYTIDDIEYWDEVSGDCTTDDNWKNRILDVPDYDLVLDVVYFGLCNHVALTAVAGSDQEVNGGETVFLNGDYMGAFHASTISYEWHAPEGIVLNSNTHQNSTFTAPVSNEDAYYVLLLYVSSGSVTSAPDDVTILVKKSTNTGVDQSSQSSMSVYPNPGSGVFEVDPGLNGESYQLTVFNSVGAKVYETGMNQSGNLLIDITNHERGIYFVNVKNDKMNLMQKIILK